MHASEAARANGDPGVKSSMVATIEANQGSLVARALRPYSTAATAIAATNARGAANGLAPDLKRYATTIQTDVTRGRIAARSATDISGYRPTCWSPRSRLGAPAERGNGRDGTAQELKVKPRISIGSASTSSSYR